MAYQKVGGVRKGGVAHGSGALELADHAVVLLLLARDVLLEVRDLALEHVDFKINFVPLCKTYSNLIIKIK